MFVFAGLAAIVALLTGHPVVGSSTQLLTTGLLNMAHVGGSYAAFQSLPAGNAMALFYTYPLWNLLAASIAFQETITPHQWLWMGVALVGALLVAHPTGSWSAWGVAMALVAALTETAIYLWFRRETKDTTQPWTDMATMYGGSGILWLLLLPFLGLGVLSGKSVASMIGFNALIGFVGYALRFYAIPNISTVAFSSLSFVGVVAAYLLGWFFVGEVPLWSQGIGAALIAIANVILLQKD